MNILFCYDSPFSRDYGGVAAVSVTLMNGFSNHGHVCYGLSIHRAQNKGGVWERQSYLPHDTKDHKNKENKAFFQRFIKDNSIDVIINQNGISQSSEWAILWGAELGVKVLTVYHNSLRSLFSCHDKRITDNTLVKKLHLQAFIDWLWRCFFRVKYKPMFRRSIELSDKVVLLSTHYFSELAWFSGVKQNEKYVAIPNPALERFNVSLEDLKKENVILFVGRLAEQKRVDYLLEIWQRIADVHQDWELIIVGNGVLHDNLKQIVVSQQIPRVSFEGQCDPLPYYKRASLFCMTSSFEGFPGVLTESMSCGCVPIVFNSFACAPDIIDDEENGYLIKPFSIESYTQHLEVLMEDDSRRQEMAKKAKIKSESFSLDKVVEMWEKAFCTKR